MKGWAAGSAGLVNELVKLVIGARSGADSLHKYRPETLETNDGSGRFYLDYGACGPGGRSSAAPESGFVRRGRYDPPPSSAGIAGQSSSPWSLGEPRWAALGQGIYQDSEGAQVRRKRGRSSHVGTGLRGSRPWHSFGSLSILGFDRVLATAPLHPKRHHFRLAWPDFVEMAGRPPCR